MARCSTASIFKQAMINPWNTLPAIAAIAPDLVIFEAGIVNDWDDKIRFRP